MRVQPLLTSSPVIDLGAVLQDLAELCQSPLSLGAPEVGRATLAVSHATTVLSRAASHAAAETSGIPAQVREALERAHEALDAARHAVEWSRRRRGLAAELTTESLPLRPPRPAVTRVPPLVRAWTTERHVTVRCADCARACVVRYEYRFSEGLVARDLRCPHAACHGRFTYYMPVNASGVAVLVAR